MKGKQGYSSIRLDKMPEDIKKKILKRKTDLITAKQTANISMKMAVYSLIRCCKDE